MDDCDSAQYLILASQWAWGRVHVDAVQQVQGIHVPLLVASPRTQGSLLVSTAHFAGRLILAAELRHL